MAVHPSTAALKTELETPSVTGADLRTIAATIKTQRPAMIPLLEQVAVIEALLFDVIENETNDKIPTESPRQTMVSLRKHVADVDDRQHKLSVALRDWETQKADILRVIGEEE